MSNTVITNYTDLNGPSTKADSSVVVIVNKDGSLSVDRNLLGTLMGDDGSQGAGISVVRVGHEGRPEDATDSDCDDDKIPHVTFSVDSYYDEPNSIIKYDSGAEMLQSLKIETRENSLVGFQNDHCYTSLTSPDEGTKQNKKAKRYDDSVIEISHAPPPKPVPSSKKITILDQQIIPKGKKVLLHPSEPSVTSKSRDVLNKPLSKQKKLQGKKYSKLDTSMTTDEHDSSSVTSSGGSLPDRDSDSDYKDKSVGHFKHKKTKAKPLILKGGQVTKSAKADTKVVPRKYVRKELKPKIQKFMHKKRLQDEESLHQVISESAESSITKTPKSAKKEKKTSAALLSDMSSLFSTPDVIRRISTEKQLSKGGKETGSRKSNEGIKHMIEPRSAQNKQVIIQRNIKNQKVALRQKNVNPVDAIPQIDEASLAQIFQDTTSASNMKGVTSISTSHSGPGMTGPLSPTLDLLGGLQPEEAGLTDLIAQLVASSENLQEVIDKQVLGKVDPNAIQSLADKDQQLTSPNSQIAKSMKAIVPKKDPIEIVRRDGRIITLPPIEAPATRASKRKTQVDTQSGLEETQDVAFPAQMETTLVHEQAKQYLEKKSMKKLEPVGQVMATEKLIAESQESWNSEDDPNRLWCICRQPHNNRFMICCDGCEDWFHGKCVNITKAMGQQMEENGVEWRCPNCVKESKIKSKSNIAMKSNLVARQKSTDEMPVTPVLPPASPTVIVYDRKSGKLLAGPKAPTAENLKNWLQENPTFEVVRPGALNSLKPKPSKRGIVEKHSIQTTLNFERIPKKSAQSPKSPTYGAKEKSDLQKETLSPQSKLSLAQKTVQSFPDTPQKLTQTPEPKKINRTSGGRSLSNEKTYSSTPATYRRKDSADNKNKQSASPEPIRVNVKKSLLEQMKLRMSESAENKLNDEEIEKFVNEIEFEMFELFKDVGMKYKAKYRSLMFNIKDRKNLSLWQKICDQSITPKQLVRFTPEELASQELAQWRDKEAKHQLDLIKKSELDLLTASKTYVLKTHKGEEVMETKTSVSTDLDPNVSMEELVTALNVTSSKEKSPESTSHSRDMDKRSSRSRRKDKEEYKKSKDKHDDDSRRSRSRKKSVEKVREERTTRRSEKAKRSESKDRSKDDSSRTRSKKKFSKSKERSRSHSRERSRSRHSKPYTRSSQQSKSKADSPDDKHRSKSQESSGKRTTRSNNKSLEDRPKSASLKDAHPEYDPHEPMITSAFSEEDLRKSGEDIYDDSYKNEDEYGGSADYELSKGFPIDTNILLPTTSIAGTSGKLSETESDQEPSSTVDTSAATVWNGCINMVDVARFYVAAHEVSGRATDLEEDLSTELDIVGRINPDTVWDYIAKMKRTSNKDIIILRLQAANDEEKMQYIALYSYLQSRKRLGVVKVVNTGVVKDLYIMPVPAQSALPAVLLPLEGPGFGEIKTHLLIAIIIRQRKKRSAPRVLPDAIPAKQVGRETRQRSYTPPVGSKGSTTLSLPMPAYTSHALSSSVKDKIAASLASAADEPYSPGESSSGSAGSGAGGEGGEGAADALRSKMDELNRQIEEQKQQIRSMARAQDHVDDEEEAYSPSRPMTPPGPSLPLTDIALPSNLQEILATIKQRSENTERDLKTE